MDVALQIHHLDDGDETDVVESALAELAGRAGLIFERPTEETNSALVRSGPIGASEEWRALSLHLSRMHDFLKHVQPIDLDPIRELGIGITLRICCSGYSQVLEPFILKECGRLDIPIQMFNDKLFMDGVTSH